MKQLRVATSMQLPTPARVSMPNSALPSTQPFALAFHGVALTAIPTGGTWLYAGSHGPPLDSAQT